MQGRFARLTAYGLIGLYGALALGIVSGPDTPTGLGVGWDALLLPFVLVSVTALGAVGAVTPRSA